MGVILIPFEGTFKNQQVVIPVVIQKNEDQYDHSDLLQHWKNGLDYIFPESPLRTYKVVLEGGGVLVDLAHNAAGEPLGLVM